MFFSSFFGGPRFSREFKCFPLSFVGREDLETGNRLILPPSALEELTRVQAPNPMLFEISDLDQRYRTHGGVLEFIAPEETCYMPYWILKQLHADEGDVLRIALKSSLPPATFVKFRPAQVALLRVYNPRALLENGLRNFVALTVGDSFAVDYNGQKYGIEVVELRPSDAVSIVETDVQVEFATPQDAARGIAGSGSSRGEPTSATGSLSEPGRGEESFGTSKQDVQPSSVALFSGTGQRPDGQPALPPSESDADDDPRPWKRRIPKGVKWTSPPAGYEPAMFGQSAANRAAVLQSAPAEFSGEGHVGGQAVAPELSQMKRLQAAERREAAQADDIARRRAEEEEARRRAAEEEEKARRHALELAERKRNQARAAESAPGQKQMTAGGAGRSPGSASVPDGSSSFCCGCLRSGSPSPDNKV
mmetsp:Transcript_48187/g.85584  ORF Transcript_48187/g.85584 Transcript_48187/m.85584 type:complete len:421 (+) Transcript_48187:36-1298(+)